MLDKEPLAASDALAAGVALSHANVIKLVRRHKASMERFGHSDLKSERVLHYPRVASPRPPKSRC